MELTLKHIKESESLADLSQCFCTNLKALNMPWGKSQTTPLKAPLGLELLLMWVVSLRTQVQFWTLDPQKICEMPCPIL